LARLSAVGSALVSAAVVATVAVAVSSGPTAGALAGAPLAGPQCEPQQCPGPSTTSVHHGNTKRAKTTTTRARTTTTVPNSLFPPSRLMPKSTFNQPVSTWPLVSLSATLVSSLVNDARIAYGNVGVNYDMPIYEVPTGTPEASISVAPGCNNFLAGTGRRAPVPAFANPPSTGDDPMVLYSPTLNREWEFWRFSQVSAGHYEACWGGSMKLSTSDGVFGWPFGESATGISYLATTVTEADIASGAIDHAIALVVPQCNSKVLPADRTDCGSSPGQPAEGQWFRFPAGAALPGGLPPFARMVFRAIQHYGLVIVDKGGAVQITAEQTSDWAAEGHHGPDPITASSWGWPEYRLINSLPWSQLQAVAPPGTKVNAAAAPAP
jgi:hypothetical protein